VLDLGCGDGSISFELLDRAESLTLVDRSEAMIRLAKAKAPDLHEAAVEFVNGDVSELERPDSYDVVLCIGVLGHVESYERVVATAARSASRGGACVIQITDAPHPLARILRGYSMLRNRLVDREAHEPRRLSVDDLVECAARFGLRRVRVQRYLPALPGSSLLPLRWTETLLLESSRWRAHGLGCEALLLFEKE
jgi:SAM-dependent methyltransferase